MVSTPGTLASVSSRYACQWQHQVHLHKIRLPMSAPVHDCQCQHKVRLPVSAQGTFASVSTSRLASVSTRYACQCQHKACLPVSAPDTLASVSTRYACQCPHQVHLSVSTPVHACQRLFAVTLLMLPVHVDAIIAHSSLEQWL